jgi:hypothetical protein
MGPLFVLVSVIWSFWDPKYLAIRQARLLGKKPQAKGRGHYIVGSARLLQTDCVNVLLRDCRLPRGSSG